MSVLQEFCILLLVLFMAFVSVGFFLGVRVKMPRRNETEIRIAIWLWLHDLYVIYVCLHIIHPHRKKIHKEVVHYSTGRPLTHLALSINLISTFCTQFQLFALKNFNFLDCLGLIDAFSANERAEIIACISLVYQLLGTSKVWKARK